ncbi:MAG: TMEM175 family protein [Chloroflexota bacterium]|nr:TMEM175 family protein [Chloroflexota bacterium]
MTDELTIAPEVDTSSAGSGLLSASGRVEAFSDGVLAIAITLLVLDLKVPAGEPGTVVRHLLDQWAEYVAYLASFMYVGVIWVNHHALFARIRRVDSGVLWRNLALLLATSVFPFPTATLAYAMQHGTHGDRLAAIALYGLVTAAMALTWLIMFSYLDRHRELVRGDVAAGFFREERRRAVLGILSPVVAIAIGVVAPAVALLVFVLMPIFYGLTTEGWTPRGRTAHRTAV